MVRPSLLLFGVVVAAFLIAASIDEGLAPTLFDRYRAPPPATCGDAMEVPDIVVVPPPRFVDNTLTPGAQISTQLP